MNADDKKGIAVFTALAARCHRIAIVIAVFALLCSPALCDDHPYLIEELNSDIGEIVKRLKEISDDLVTLRIDVAQMKQHHHEHSDNRLRNWETKWNGSTERQR